MSSMLIYDNLSGKTVLVLNSPRVQQSYMGKCKNVGMPNGYNVVQTEEKVLLIKYIELRPPTGVNGCVLDPKLRP